MVRKVSHGLVKALLTIIIAFALVVIVGGYMGFRAYVIQSGSMEPALTTGSVVVVNENASYDSIEVGDIVAFRTATGKQVTHRVIAITQEGFETQGDNNEMSDGITTTRANFRGQTYDFCIPGLGFYVSTLNTPKGTIGLVLMVAALLILEGMLKPDEDDGKEDEEDDKPAESAEAVSEDKLGEGAESAAVEGPGPAMVGSIEKTE